MPKFILVPFENTNIPEVQITGNIQRHAENLSVDYKLSGNLDKVSIQNPVTNPTRKNELWKDSCFEFFIAVNDKPDYWEFNLSPAGYWNCYRFDGYRKGMSEETAIKELPFLVDRNPQHLGLRLTFSLSPLIQTTQILDVGISAVIKENGSGLSYWSLAHLAQQPDFYLRDSFKISLPFKA